MTTLDFAAIRRLVAQLTPYKDRDVRLGRWLELRGEEKTTWLFREWVPVQPDIVALAALLLEVRHNLVLWVGFITETVTVDDLEREALKLRGGEKPGA